MKKDKFLRARGGTAQLIEISCASCNKEIIKYQKDGIGFLHRCYLNRIVGPEKYARLQHDKNIIEPRDIPKLVCTCGETIGYPMRHKDGRLAFRLDRGKFKRKKINN